jgi:uncharacterized membrane protein
MRWQDGPLYFHDSVAGGWPLIVLLAILTAAVVVAVVYLVRYLVRATPSAGGTPALASGAAGHTVGEEGGAPAGAAATLPVAPTDTARDLLRRRYAAGEIDREEYLQKLQDL